jgi:hypothetical protein
MMGDLSACKSKRTLIQLLTVNSTYVSQSPDRHVGVVAET